MAPKQTRTGSRTKSTPSPPATGPTNPIIERLEGLIHELNGLSYEDEGDRFDDVVAELVNHGELMRERLRTYARSLAYQERRAGVEALGRLGYPERVSIIIEGLSDANWKVRRSAALAVTANPFGDALKPLLKLVDDDHRELRLAVLEALGHLKRAEAVSPLSRLLSDADWRVRQDAAVALGRISNLRALEPLIGALTDDDEDVRSAVAIALRKLVPKTTEARLKQAVTKLSDKERRATATALGKDNLSKGLDRLVAELQQTISAAVDVTELASFGRVMTSEDQLDTLDMAFERETEVNNLVKLLLKDGNSSVILVGEAGIGKTSVVHALARRAAQDHGFAVLETSTPELMVGTKYIGEWETKLRDLVEKIKKPRKVLLYLTNVNDLPGAGTTSSSKQNFVTLLAPYMRRGDITVLGESTVEAMRNGINKDLSVKRLFQTVKLDEPDRKTTLRILDQLLAHLSQQHGVVLSASSEVLDLLMEVSGTYYSTMAQPGRSVTVLKQVVNALIERLGEREEPSPTRLSISAKDVIEGLARFTGLPELLLNDTLPLRPDEVRAFFTKRVLGQPEAVDAIVDLITLIKAGLNDPSKPFGVFLFVGPTGVGKTEIAKALAEFIFGSPDRLLRFDLSEFKDYDSFEKLIGGTWRNRDEGQLTTKVREQPFSVILLDEIEKAHPNVFDLFLQVFDDGRLTDARGRVADFRHTIIIMTSNLASAFTPGGPVGFGDDGGGGMASSAGIMREVHRFFRPEFLNRIDRTVVFRPLQADTMRKIALRELGKVLLRSGLLRRRLVVDIDPSVVDHLMEQGFSQALGARPLKRSVESQVLLPVAREIVGQGPDYEGDLIRVTAPKRGLGAAARKVRITRASTDAHAQREAMLQQGAAALEGTMWSQYAKRPRSWTKAKDRWEGSNALFILLTHTPFLMDMEETIAALEERVSGVTFWDDADRARDHLVRLVQYKGVNDTLSRLKNQLEALGLAFSEPNDRPKLADWYAELVEWLIQARLTFEQVDAMARARDAELDARRAAEARESE